MPAPQLLAPPDGQTFARDAVITLQWTPAGPLPANGYYVVTLAYSHFGDTWYDETPWIKETSWSASEHNYLPDLSDDQLFRWSVQVMRQTGVDANGRPLGEPLSLSSAVRTFTWNRTPGGGGGPAPTTPAVPPPETPPVPPPETPPVPTPVQPTPTPPQP